jgi:hypothetical protein
MANKFLFLLFPVLCYSAWSDNLPCEEVCTNLFSAYLDIINDSINSTTLGGPFKISDYACRSEVTSDTCYDAFFAYKRPLGLKGVPDKMEIHSKAVTIRLADMESFAAFSSDLLSSFDAIKEAEKHEFAQLIYKTQKLIYPDKSSVIDAPMHEVQIDKKLNVGRKTCPDYRLPHVKKLRDSYFQLIIPHSYRSEFINVAMLYSSLKFSYKECVITDYDERYNHDIYKKFSTPFLLFGDIDDEKLLNLLQYFTLNVYFESASAIHVADDAVHLVIQKKHGRSIFEIPEYSVVVQEKQGCLEIVKSASIDEYFVHPFLHQLSRFPILQKPSEISHVYLFSKKLNWPEWCNVNEVLTDSDLCQISSVLMQLPSTKKDELYYYIEVEEEYPNSVLSRKQASDFGSEIKLTKIKDIWFYDHSDD